MRLVGRFGLVCAKLTAAGLLLTGAAACAGVAAAPAAVPPGGAAPARTAPAGGGLNGQPAFVTAVPAVDATRHAVAAEPTDHERGRYRVRGCRGRSPGGAGAAGR